MNPMDSPLDRLLAAAARAKRPLPKTAPLRVQSRVLAHGWGPVELFDDWMALIPTVRRALVWACAIAVVAVAIGYLELRTPASDEALWLNSALTLDSLP